ncbi:hypothetical protein [Yinghuangia sp. YIM S09857]|uniref:hypothetical protein n=1 Tax=Yinghuangia sp. YIM S09857 TaxID=3436929 RepID=UPI003F53345C
MSSEELDWDDIIDAARKAARSVARRNWDLDADDIYGEIITWAVANRPQLDKLSPGMQVKALGRAGSTWAEKERRTAIVSRGYYIYTPDVVRKVLAEWYYDETARETMPGREEPHGSSDYSSPAITIWDIDQAMLRLSEQHVTAIERRYLLGEEMRAPAERKAVSRAVEKLTWTLNYRLVDRADDANDCRAVRAA